MFEGSGNVTGYAVSLRHSSAEGLGGGGFSNHHEKDRPLPASVLFVFPERQLQLDRLAVVPSLVVKQVFDK